MTTGNNDKDSGGDNLLSPKENPKPVKLTKKRALSQWVDRLKIYRDVHKTSKVLPRP